MVDKKYYLLQCLSEECSEVAEACNRIAVRISKALRFGIDEVQFGQPDTNADRIADELKDLLATAEELESLGVIKRVRVEAKKSKLSRYMVLSHSLGMLALDEDEPASDNLRLMAHKLWAIKMSGEGPAEKEIDWVNKAVCILRGD